MEQKLDLVQQEPKSVQKEAEAAKALSERQEGDRRRKGDDAQRGAAAEGMDSGKKKDNKFKKFLGKAANGIHGANQFAQGFGVGGFVGDALQKGDKIAGIVNGAGDRFEKKPKEEAGEAGGKDGKKKKKKGGWFKRLVNNIGAAAGVAGDLMDAAGVQIPGVSEAVKYTKKGVKIVKSGMEMKDNIHDAMYNEDGTRKKGPGVVTGILGAGVKATKDITGELGIDNPALSKGLDYTERSVNVANVAIGAGQRMREAGVDENGNRRTGYDRVSHMIGAGTEILGDAAHAAGVKDKNFDRAIDYTQRGLAAGEVVANGVGDVRDAAYDENGQKKPFVRRAIDQGRAGLNVASDAKDAAGIEDAGVDNVLDIGNRTLDAAEAGVDGVQAVRDAAYDENGQKKPVVDRVIDQAQAGVDAAENVKNAAEIEDAGVDNAIEKANEVVGTAGAIRDVVGMARSGGAGTAGEAKPAAKSEAPKREGAITAGIGGPVDVNIGPKGAGQGKDAAEAYANSGLSYQIENKGGLGGKMSADLEKDLDKTNAALPGEKNVPINDGRADNARRNAADKKQNSNRNSSKDGFDPSLAQKDYDSSSIDKQKERSQRGSKEKLGPAPDVQVDTKAMDDMARQADGKFAEAQNEVHKKADSVDTSLEIRGFNDLHRPKEELKLDTGIQTDEAQQAADLAEMSDEAKGLLDASDEAKKAASDMAAERGKVDAAQAERDAEIAKASEEEKAAMDKAISDANAEERNIAAKAKAEADAEVRAQTKQYEGELAKCNDAQMADIIESKNKINEESLRVSDEIDDAYAEAEDEQEAVAQEEAKKKQEEENKGGIFQWVADKIKAAVNAVTEWAKRKFAEIVNRVKSEVFKLMDGLVAFASFINKDLGKKLEAHTKKYKQILNQMADTLIANVNKALDKARDQVNKLVDQVAAKLQEKWNQFKEFVSAAWNKLKEAWSAFAEFVGNILEFLGNIFIPPLKFACNLMGVDASFLDQVIPTAKQIIMHPVDFFVTLFKGFVGGFRQFGENIGDNLINMATNLLNIWLGALDVKVPKLTDFSLASVIKLVLDLIGIDVDGILDFLGLRDKYKEWDKKSQFKNWGKEEEPKKEEPKKEEEDKYKGQAAVPDRVNDFLEDLPKNGINAVISLITPNLDDLVPTIISGVLQSVASEVIKQGIIKLASMSNPVGAIVQAIKGAWDLIMFIKDNMEQIATLGKTVMACLSSAANGETATVSNAVEAALCQVIPLVIDMLLRLCGINMGNLLKKAFDPIRKTVKGVLDKALSWVQKGIDKVHAPIAVSADAREKKEARRAEEQKAREKTTDNERAYAANHGDTTAQWAMKGKHISNRISQAKKEQKDQVITLKSFNKNFKVDDNGEFGKLGTMGVDLSKSEGFKAVDAYYQNKREHAAALKTVEQLGGKENLTNEERSQLTRAQGLLKRDEGRAANVDKRLASLVEQKEALLSNGINSEKDRQKLTEIQDAENQLRDQKSYYETANKRKTISNALNIARHADEAKAHKTEQSRNDRKAVNDYYEELEAQGHYVTEEYAKSMLGLKHRVEEKRTKEEEAKLAREERQEKWDEKDARHQRAQASASQTQLQAPEPALGVAPIRPAVHTLDPVIINNLHSKSDKELENLSRNLKYLVGQSEIEYKQKKEEGASSEEIQLAKEKLDRQRSNLGLVNSVIEEKTK